MESIRVGRIVVLDMFILPNNNNKIVIYMYILRRVEFSK